MGRETRERIEAGLDLVLEIVSSTGGNSCIREMLQL